MELHSILGSLLNRVHELLVGNVYLVLIESIYSIYIYIYIYRVSQEEGTKLQESVPYVEIY